MGYKRLYTKKMKRNLSADLLRWKNSVNRKPLVLQGARQVGKTYLLKEFGTQEYANSLYLNFEKNTELAQFFTSSLEPVKIIENLSLYFEKKIKSKDTLLIFDEIQECPRALNSLKYFCEDAPDFHIAAAGSLLGVKLVHTAGFPVGKVNFLDLYPLDFLEFLDAIDKPGLRSYLEQINTAMPLLEPFHNELLDLLKKYMIIGGMPAAVVNYARTRDLIEVRDIQNEILKAYDLDFAKHAPKTDIMRISQIWQSIPRQLAKDNNKFIFSVVRERARAREYEVALQWLLEAGLIIKSYNLTKLELPLPAYGDTRAFKVFMLDTGLLSAISKVPLSLVATNNQLFVNEFKGAITENYVAQALTTIRKPLYYWTSAATAEVDFILEYNGNIYPLEVKSGTSQHKKSLIEYDKKYQPNVLFRVSAMNLKHDGKICNLPLYLCAYFTKFVQTTDSTS